MINIKMIEVADLNESSVPDTSPDTNGFQDDDPGMSPSEYRDTSRPEDTRDIDPSCCVQVAVRVRPLLALEGDDENCVQVLPPHQRTSNSVPTAIQVGGAAGPQFTFDEVFGMAADQIHVYESRVAPLISSCLDGYNATILAYGQTGSGKTHTIMGPNPTTAVSPEDVDAGVIPRALTAIFANLEEKKQQQAKAGHELEYQVSVQFLELYGEEIRDLLASTSHRNNDKLTIRDALGTDEPEVVGATQSAVSSAAQALQHLSHGMLRRVTGATAMNESSSRSHAIFAVVIEQVIMFHSQDGGDRSADDEDQMQVLRSKFNFVDLAGAERQKRTGASGKRLKEGIDINKGLSNLGNVISALGDPRKRGRTHVPYRDAKLTRLLKGSLGGNHKTLMIACVSPAAVNMGESLNCLRYANRAKNIQNKAVVNVDANTRLVQELQGQVAALASDLLKAIDGNVSDVQFSRESLLSLSVGGALGPSSKAMSPPPKPVRPVLDGNVNDRLKETERELLSTQALLRQTQKHHDDAELELFTVRAQNNVFNAQISVLTDNSNNNEFLGSGAMKQAFIEKSIDYEKEISRLQGQVRDAETAAMNHQNFSNYPFIEDVSIDDVESLVLQEEKLLEASRDRLRLLRSTASPTEELKRSVLSSSPSSNDIEADDCIGPANFDRLTSRYLSPEINGDDLSGQLDTPGSEFLDFKVQQFGVDIKELTRSIEAKEKLIQRIRRNKEREMAMRKFFEEKLTELQNSLAEKERERDQLRHDLEMAEKRSEASDELANLLHQKQEQINSMKKVQANYRRQTVESTKRLDEIERLKQLENDVKSMKKRKADLQKELALEKRDHMKELGRLNKILSQKDREINKIQKISNQRAVEMEKAKTISKTHLEESLQLKKALRLYKRGVGLDPVIVGRRQARACKDRKERIPVQVADSIRDFFDSKVSMVVQKEALVDRLAAEWEEYFDLITRLRDEGDSRDSKEDLKIQIEFKNERIRKIAKRLQKPDFSTRVVNKTPQSGDDHFLFDKDFKDMFDDYDPETARSLGARVLFGMIVRERRRVAALARTASLLDDRVQAAEKALVVKEAALRSFVEEHRQEVVDLEQRQHDQILCLIDMVKEGFMTSDVDSNAADTFAMFQKELLVLSNERALVLEGQLSELPSMRAKIEEYEEKVNNLNEIVSNKAQAYELLDQECHNLRTSLRQIRDEALKYVAASSDLGLARSVLEMVETFLHSGVSEPRDRIHGRLQNFSPRFKRHIELMHSSDSEDADGDDGDPSSMIASSTELMADLSLIAAGKIPPSLCSPDILKEAPALDDPSVFDRLANPRSFTGTQKRVRMKKSVPADDHEEAPGQHSIGEDAPVHEVSSHRGTKLLAAGSAESLVEGSKQAYQSVFDKLGSPSQYTGTHKERFHDGKMRKDRSADESTAKVPSKKSFDETVIDGFVSESFAKGDYAKQDVFDRLQKTTTQAAAIRQSETLLVGINAYSESKASDAVASTLAANNYRTQLDENRSGSPSKDKAYENSSTKAMGEMRTGLDLEAYTKQNVFDRLQKTTTLAVAVRQSETLHLECRSNIDTSNKAVISPVSQLLHSETSSSRKPVVKRKTATNVVSNADSSVTSDPKLNVFERLNKTTTRAYAKRASKQIEED